MQVTTHAPLDEEEAFGNEVSAWLEAQEVKWAAKGSGVASLRKKRANSPSLTQRLQGRYL